jgi:hypothetical protein
MELEIQVLPQMWAISPRESLRTNADDRFSLGPFGAVEGGDGFVEGSHFADVCPQPTMAEALDDLS